jgi:hypothetical protein
VDSKFSLFNFFGDLLGDNFCIIDIMLIELLLRIYLLLDEAQRASEVRYFNALFVTRDSEGVK